MQDYKATCNSLDPALRFSCVSRQPIPGCENRMQGKCPHCRSLTLQESDLGRFEGHVRGGAWLEKHDAKTFYPKGSVRSWSNLGSQQSPHHSSSTSFDEVPVWHCGALRLLDEVPVHLVGEECANEQRQSCEWSWGLFRKDLSILER